MVQYLMASHTRFRQSFSTNKCDRHLTLSYEPVSISNNLTFFSHNHQNARPTNHRANPAKK